MSGSKGSSGDVTGAAKATKWQRWKQSKNNWERGGGEKMVDIVLSYTMNCSTIKYQKNKKLLLLYIILKFIIHDAYETLCPLRLRIFFESFLFWVSAPGGTVVGNPPANAEAMGLIPDMVSLQAEGQLSPCTTTHWAHALEPVSQSYWNPCT